MIKQLIRKLYFKVIGKYEQISSDEYLKYLRNKGIKIGIGTKILKDKLEKYNDTDIELQYFKQNPVRVLYERLGFEKSGETSFHYQMIKSKSVKLKK